MKIILFIVLLVFCANIALAQQSQTNLKTVDGIEKIEKEVNAAIEDSDNGALKRLLTDDSTAILSRGLLLKKKAYLDEVRTWNIASVKSEDLEVRLLGDTAIAQGTFIVLYRNDSNAYLYYTRVYVWKTDKWQLASQQYTVKNR